MRVRWARRAFRDYAAVGEYLLARNAAAASRLARHVIARTKALVEFPRRGWPGRVAGTRELFIVGTPYLVAYRIHAEEIVILGFMHGRRKWPETFQDTRRPNRDTPA